MGAPTERLVDTNGVRLRVVEAGEPGAPVVILAHGFPELAYSWRHQIPALADAGYHVLAPDQRGYGGSSRPEAIEAYDIHRLTADLVGLLDDVGAERAVWVGHDWGAVVVWNAPLLHADRVAAVAALSVPALPRAQVPPTQAFRSRFGENFFYILYFQEPGIADAELNGDPARTMRRMIGGLRPPGDQSAAMRMLAPGPDGFIDRLPEPAGLPAWISQEELDHYIGEFTAHRFHRRPELVPQLRPQLGDHGRPRRQDDLRALVVHCGHSRSRLDVHPHRPRCGGDLRPVSRGADRRGRSLAAAGTSR